MNDSASARSKARSVASSARPATDVWAPGSTIFGTHFPQRSGDQNTDSLQLRKWP